MTDAELNVATEYEKSLSVPSVKPKHQFVLCPIGLVGSGKTTVVKPLAEKLSLIRISGDEIRHIMKDTVGNYDAAFEIGAMLIKKYLAQGYSIAIDSDCAGEHTLKLISEAQAKMGINPVWIHINPPESFILNKLKNFKHTWLFKDGDEAIANYMRRKPLHENLTMPFVYTFDTSRGDIAQQIIEAEAKIKTRIQ